MASKKSVAEKAAPVEKVETAEVAKNRGGRVAYETPRKHHTVLERSGKRLRNAREAVAAADEALYEKVLAALLDGVKPSAITRSTGENHTAIQRMVRRARAEREAQAASSIDQANKTITTSKTNPLTTRETRDR